jgi:hypothetical protein
VATVQADNGRGRPEAASKHPDGDQTSSNAEVRLTPSPMTAKDRDKLAVLARKRAKVTETMVSERVNVLRADVEDQLAANYKFDDARWADINQRTMREVAKTDAEIAAICRRVGIPEHLRPKISVGWDSRGENLLASRRAELRKLAYARIDAAAESAKVHIGVSLVDVETELIRDGLESAEAIAYLDSMPTPEQLLPQIAVAELEPGTPTRRHGKSEEDFRGRFGGWEPPTGAGAALLTPSSASIREEKRQAIAAALTANPGQSDRQIASLVGVSHKTVGKLRSVAGEIPTEGGEIPSDDGESS